MADPVGEEQVGPEHGGPADAGDEQLAAPLLAPVRARLLALVADALDGLPVAELPPAVRAVARFTPARRARLGAAALGAAVDGDAAFRAVVAARVAGTLPGLAERLRAGQLPAAADPLDVAALAYLDRPPGWPGLLAAATAGSSHPADAQLRAELGRLRELLAAERAAATQERQRRRADLERRTQENAVLRGRVQELRQRVRSAQEVASRAQAAADRARAEAGAVTDRAAAEGKRLRARVAELEEQAGVARRGGRDERVAASLRARLLLDTVVDAAAGLRRELALPPVAGRPADDVLDSTRSAGAPEASTQLAADDAAAVDAVLALPGTHVVVDGYNVSRLEWDAMPLEAQRRRLVTALATLVARTGVEVSVVFDGADLAVPPPVTAPRGVRVLFSPGGTTADEVVRRLVAAEPPGRPVLVVSSDREVVEGVRRAGVRTLGSAGLLRRLNTR